MKADRARRRSPASTARRPAAGPAANLAAGSAFTRERIESGAPPRRRMGAVLFALGCLGAALGSPGAGIPLALAAFGFAVLPESKRKGLLCAAALAALAAAYGLGWAGEEIGRRRQAGRQFEALERHIVEYAHIVGSPPATLRELEWRLYDVFRDGKPVDPWGRPWTLETPGRNGAPFELASPGPDGLSGTPDDIGRAR
ncbi:MAG: putative type II secretion system protein G precursor [candidate division BRC1 bacterium ADurb.BinA364]|nr:MAG: putative type II secretion system protein G precursor [candidate division BRC1 bacterium ADurb.BinA364]